MEKRDAEKTWDNFWMTGRVDDYLSYRNSIGNVKEQIEESKTHGRVSKSDGNGVNDHAHIGI